MSYANHPVLTAEGKLYHKGGSIALPLLRSLPGARWDVGGQYWKVSLNEGDRHRLLEVADQLGVEVDPSLRLPLSPTAIRAEDAGLYPFQVQGVDWLSRRQKALLADEMGLGKSTQTLLALPGDAAVLVLCPACLQYNWHQEAHRWRPEFTVSVVEGTKAFRLPVLGEIVVVSYDSLPEDLESFNFTSVHVVADEAHKLKGLRTKRNKRVRQLAKMVKAVWALTGTPLLNEPGELYAMLNALGMAEDAFGGLSRFMELFNAKQGEWGTVWGEPKAEVTELLRRVMFRRLRCDVLPELPSKQYQTIPVPLLTKDADLLEELNELWGKWRTYLEDQDELPPFSAFSAVRERLARTRIKAMMEFITLYEEQQERLVVFSAHRGPVEAFKDREGWGCILGDTPPSDRQAIVARFQARKLKGIASTIQAGGVGLTMTRASTVLFVDLDWTPANNIQAEDRVCRIGQEANKVQIVRMVSDHVLDQRVLEVLDRKANLVRVVVEGD